MPGHVANGEAQIPQNSASLVHPNTQRYYKITYSRPNKRLSFADFCCVMTNIYQLLSGC